MMKDAKKEISAEKKRLLEVFLTEKTYKNAEILLSFDGLSSKETHFQYFDKEQQSNLRFVDVSQNACEIHYIAPRNMDTSLMQFVAFKDPQKIRYLESIYEKQKKLLPINVYKAGIKSQEPNAKSIVYNITKKNKGVHKQLLKLKLLNMEKIKRMSHVNYQS